MHTNNAINILIVDDDATADSPLKNLLSDLGATPVPARSGAEAQQKIASMDFAAVVLDNGPADSNGMAEARRIRAHPRTKSTPIVFMPGADQTGFPDDEAYGLGAVDFIRKPFRPAALQSKLAFFIEVFRQRQALRETQSRLEHQPEMAALASRQQHIEHALEQLVTTSERRHRLYETILSNTPDLAYVFDLDHRFTYANEVLLKMWGQTWEDAIGKNCLDLGYEPWHAEMHDREIKQVKATKQPVRGEVPFHGTFGRRIYEYIFVPVFGPAGDVEAIAGTTRDVTERKQAEEEMAALLNQEKRRAAILSRVAEAGKKISATLLIDNIMQLLAEEVRINLGAHQAVASLTGDNGAQIISSVSLSEKYAHSCSDDVQPDGAGIYATLCHGDQPMRLPLETLEKHPAWNRIEQHADSHPPLRGWLAAPLIGHSGNNLGLIQTSDKYEGEFTEEDESILKHLAAIAAVGIENARLYDSLREQDRRKDEFLATLAHELRNPLAPLRTGLDLLKMHGQGKPAQRVGDMMERQLTHMVRLVDDLMDVSRLRCGKVELKQERLALHKILEAALETNRPLIESAQHKLSISILDDSLYVNGDLTRLAQSLGNLLNNAAKYTPRGGTISLSAQRAGEEALIRVTDTGIGISEEMLPKVFELFTQVSNGMERTQGGLGIGLSLVRKLVDMHGGTITAESAGLGHGSTFSVRLPLAREASATRNPDGTPPPVLKKISHAKRILVVDDNIDAAETLGMLLDIIGHQTRIVHTGMAAIEAARDFHPDAVFLDIGLPGMSGYDVAAALRNESAFQNTVLVALTGWGSDEDRRNSKDAGFDFHLTKPVDVSVISNVLARFLPAE